MKKVILVILVFLIPILSSCSFFNKNPDGNYYDIKNFKGDLHFPEEIGIKEFTNNWYSRQLAALEEPVIPAQTDEYKTIYRFTCLRTFHNPFSIRIEINEKDESAILFFKMSDGAGGYAPGDLMTNEQKILELEEIKSFIETIEKYDYWEMPFDEISENFSGGRDGSKWIIEMLKDGKYHAISRWTPEYKEDKNANGQIEKVDRIGDLNAVYELGLYFIELSGQEIEELY